MARPTKLTKELIKTALDYVDDCKAFEDVVPTVAGMALAMGISKDTVYEWANAKNEDGSLKNKEFSDAISDLKAKQEKELVANGLQSVFNPAITRLMLSSNHGYSEKTATELTGANGGPVQIQDVEITFKKAGA